MGPWCPLPPHLCPGIQQGEQMDSYQTPQGAELSGSGLCIQNPKGQGHLGPLPLLPTAESSASSGSMEGGWPVRKEERLLRTSLCLVTLIFFSRVERKPEIACKRSLRSHLPESRRKLMRAGALWVPQERAKNVGAGWGSNMGGRGGQTERAIGSRHSSTSSAQRHIFPSAPPTCVCAGCP